MEQRNKFLLIFGDLNNHIGNDEFRVIGNHDKISFGGKLVRGLFESGKYICMKNSDKTAGGPFTRYDPSDTTNMSCLDSVIVSRAAFGKVKTKFSRGSCNVVIAKPNDDFLKEQRVEIENKL